MRDARTPRTTGRLAAGAPAVDRHFGVLLAAVTAVAGAVRAAAVIAHGRDDLGFSDPLWFVHQGAALADGEWFVDPAAYAFCGVSVPGAQHPPLFGAYLGVAHLAGLDTQAGARWAAVALGLVTVVLAGLVGRRVAGATAGLVAATLAAVYPYFWDTEAIVLSEALFVPLCLLVMWAAWAALDRRSAAACARLGLAVGLAVLTRSEAIVLAFVLVLPVVARVARARPDLAHGWWRFGAAAAGGAAILLAPWVAFNLARFDEPVLLGNGLGVTLAGANCDQTWPGGRVPGWWSGRCVPPLALTGDGRVVLARRAAPEPAFCRSPHVTADEGARDAVLRDAALDYVGDHLSQVPEVLAMRAGRMWGLYRPFGTTQIETVEGRPRPREALAGFLLLLPLGIAGLAVLRARRVPLLPAAAMLAMVTLTALVTYGHPRFRLAADAALVVAAGAALGTLASRVSGRPRRVPGAVRAGARPEP